MARQQLKMFAGLLALAVAAIPASAFAQAAPANVPSYALPPPGSAQETIHGQIAALDDADSLQVSDDRGFVDSVRLQQGTVIVPSGTHLQPGMRVTIVGAPRGSVFAAARIDVAVVPAAPPAPPQPPALAPAMLPPGTELTGSLGLTLDSKSAFVGEDVILTNVASSDGAIGHATLLGRVTDVTHPGEGRNAQVRVHFDTLLLPDGTTSPIDGVVVSMKVKTKNNTAKELGGALLGMLAGNAIGKSLFGVSGGGIVGAAGGFMIAQDNRSDVVIPENSAITVRLEKVRRQAS